MSVVKESAEMKKFTDACSVISLPTVWEKKKKEKKKRGGGR